MTDTIIRDMKLEDIQHHVERIRAIIARNYAGGPVILTMDEIRDLMKCAASWCDVTEGIWLGKHMERH
jgi:hypothetical protein